MSLTLSVRMPLETRSVKSVHQCTRELLLDGTWMALAAPVPLHQRDQARGQGGLLTVAPGQVEGPPPGCAAADVDGEPPLREVRELVTGQPAPASAHINARRPHEHQPPISSHYHAHHPLAALDAHQQIDPDHYAC